MMGERTITTRLRGARRIDLREYSAVTSECGGRCSRHHDRGTVVSLSRCDSAHVNTRPDRARARSRRVLYLYQVTHNINRRARTPPLSPLLSFFVTVPQHPSIHFFFF